MNTGLRFFLTLILILGLGLQVLAFIDEEKPCGHAQPAGFLRDMAPTTEQQKLDMHYYAINFDLDISDNSMVQSFTVNFEVVDSTVQVFELDYSTNNPGVGVITVETVILNGDTTTFTHSGDLLQVPAPEGVQNGDLFAIQIFAHAGPAANRDDQGFNWDYENGQRSIYTNSQPYSARDWWPSVDYPRDKADSMDIVVTIEESFVVASNGRLISNAGNGNGTRTWHWHVGHPIATYLVSLSIYNFYQWGTVYVDANNDTLPIQFYTYTDPGSPNPAYMTENYLLVPEIITLYADLFGPYPFMDEKYGHAEWGESFGMEHQTLTSMGDPTERRVAHELCHMWYGDMITCNSYHHIWLNEGFARYAEALWWEEHYGPAGYWEKMASFEYYGTGTIFVEDPENESIFGINLSYNKPAWVLHMLRHIVGDDTFFEILQSYAADPRFKYGTATTEDFQMVCEEITGLDLTSFFQQWIYGSGYPHYRAYRAQTGSDLLVQTIQQGTTFDMPVDFQITTNLGVIDTVLQIDESFMTFNFTLEPGEIVTGLVMDPEGWILKSTSYVVGLFEDQVQGPVTFGLGANYPNPFNPSTTIPYALTERGPTTLTILNMRGQLVRELVQENQARGQHQVAWNGRDQRGLPVDAGVYLCRLEAGAQTAIQKLLLVK